MNTRWHIDIFHPETDDLVVSIPLSSEEETAIQTIIPASRGGEHEITAYVGETQRPGSLEEVVTLEAGLLAAMREAADSAEPVDLNERVEGDVSLGPDICLYTYGGACPFQAEGHFSHAEIDWPFYFRSRGEHWSLDVAEPGFEPCGESIWTYIERYSEEPYAAGYLSDEEARRFIREAALRFCRWQEEQRPDVDGHGFVTALKLRDLYRGMCQSHGEQFQGRLEAEREVARCHRALGLQANPEKYVIAQVSNGVK